MKKLGTIPLSSDILTKSHIGLWAFEMDEGLPPRMYVDEAMLSLIGLDHQIPPEETYHAWYDHIDDGSYDLVSEAVAKMVAGEHSEVQYPWHHPDGHTMIVRCGGVRNMAYTRGIRIEGTHQDVTEVLHLDEEKQRINREFINRMAGADELFLVDCAGETVKTIQDVGHGHEHCETESYYSIVRHYIETGVSEIDREMMRQATDLQNILQKTEYNREYTVQYRDITSGIQRFYEMKCIRLSPNEILQSYSNKDAQIVGNIIYNKLLDDYHAVYGLDLDSGAFEVMKGTVKDAGYEKGTILPFEEAMQHFAALYDGETKAFFEKHGSIAYLKQRFAKEDKATYTFKSRFPEQETWASVLEIVLTRHPDGTPALFAFAYSYLDEETQHALETQEKLNDSNKVIAALSEDYNCVDFVILTDNKLQDVAVNLRASDLLQRLIPTWVSETSMSAKLDLLLQNVVYGPDAPKFYADTRRERVIDALNSRKSYYLETRFCIKGEIHYYQFKFSGVYENDRLTGFVVGIRLVDERVQKEMEEHQRLSDALDMAKSANKAKTTFLFNMSHDIRTPMNAIIGFLNMAKMQIDDRQKVLECIDKSQQASDLLLSLINSVLEMSRIEAGKAELNETQCKIDYSFEGVDTIMKSLAQKKGIDLRFHIGEIRDHYVYADVDRLNRVLINIVSNAIKYTNAGGWIRATCEQIGRKDDRGIYRYTFADNGIGMSRDFQRHLFEEFARENNTTASGIQGTGLGLSVVKAFVALMQGTVECVSELGKGSTFTVTVPLKIQQKHEGPVYLNPDTGAGAYANGQPVPEPKEANFAGKRALLVEDNDMNREIAAFILENVGFTVEEANDGMVAVDLLREKGPDYYDAVLMDIQMPMMDGYEATRAIRSMYPGAKLPIIAVSANAFAEDKAKSLEAGMNEHLAKPIKAEELKRILKRYL